MEANEILIGVVFVMWATTIGLHHLAMRRIDSLDKNLRDEIRHSEGRTRTEIMNLDSRLLAEIRHLRGYGGEPPSPDDTPRTPPPSSPPPRPHV